MNHGGSQSTSRNRLFGTVSLMVASAVTISAATIMYFNMLAGGDELSRVGNNLELVAITLMPYMISAVVAALTAIGVIALLPMLRAQTPAQKIVSRLRELGGGDLSSSVRVQSASGLTDIAHEINVAVENLNRQVAHLKVINRRQWDVLCEIRSAAEASDTAAVLQRVETMESNWNELAEVEAQLNT